MTSKRSGRFGALLTIVLAAAMLTACGLVGSADPVSAVTASVRDWEGTTPTVRATIPTGGGTLVLYSFQHGTNCYFGEMFAEQRMGRWHAGSGGHGGGPCPGTAGAGQPAYSSFSGTSSNGIFSYSIASGEVFDPDIVRVDVTWDDGTVTAAVVTNGIYYSVREGIEATVTSVEAYDSKDQIVPEEP